MNCYGVVTGTNAYTLDVSFPAGFKLSIGDTITIRPLNANTGPATLDVGFGPMSLTLNGAALTNGQLEANKDRQCTFVGSGFALDNAGGGASFVGTSSNLTLGDGSAGIVPAGNFGNLSATEITPTFWCGTSTGSVVAGTNTTYAVSNSRITSYQDGLRVAFYPHAVAFGGAKVYLNVAGLGAVQLFRRCASSGFLMFINQWNLQSLAPIICTYYNGAFICNMADGAAAVAWYPMDMFSVALGISETVTVAESLVETGMELIEYGALISTVNKNGVQGSLTYKWQCSFDGTTWHDGPTGSVGSGAIGSTSPFSGALIGAVRFRLVLINGTTAQTVSGYIYRNPVAAGVHQIVDVSMLNASAGTTSFSSTINIADYVLGGRTARRYALWYKSDVAGTLYTYISGNAFSNASATTTGAAVPAGTFVSVGVNGVIPPQVQIAFKAGGENQTSNICKLIIQSDPSAS